MKLLKFIFSKTFLINILIAFCLFIIAIQGVLIGLKKYTRYGQEIAVPDITGLSVKEAGEILLNKKLNFLIADSTYKTNTPAGIILEQQPESGAKVKQERKIYLTINTSIPPMVPMPLLKGNSSLKFASIKLQSLGLKTGEITYVSYPDYQVVLEQKINGEDVEENTKVPKGSVIDLVLGDGKGRVKLDLPNFVGLQIKPALFLVEANQLSIGTVNYIGDIKDTATAYVYKQYPIWRLGAQIRSGERIDLFVSQTKPSELE